ncbi:hypothetical protein BCR35DRAFT_351549 [Leucosporidium creatinivorum]|uniref:Uncharacterized protein n=1 Tax=Leucosporidium creatinivorum TaxID=106004 RepID=A0A1Y2FQX5_9BASI|nr:hypothetical protein BCR35DRAFT_351549 [Leucosporidium creatinivorum]
MRILSTLVAALALSSTSKATGSTSNATDYPLFPSSSASDSPPQPPLQLLHTSLSTLLPILPYLSPPPSHTLLLTLATPAFKPLLFNWLCFLQHKAHWGQPETPVGDDEPQEIKMKQKQWDTPARDVLKLLVVTSDEALARELTEEHGVVVWWLRGVDWDEEERRAKEGDNDDGESATAQARIDRLLQDDLFTTLRTMDLLLPPHPPLGKQQGMLEWGSLHYQSLMLERTLVMTALTGALVESQKVDKEQREKEEAEWWERVLAHDWQESRLLREPFVGVKGLLLVDNDAAFLPLLPPLPPLPTLRHSPLHPLLPDMSPSQRNSWGTHSMPCACFIYSRTSDADSSTASHPLHLDSSSSSTSEVNKNEEYLPAEGAALAWRWTTLCHVSMLLKSLDRAREQAKWIMATSEDDEEDDEDDLDPSDDAEQEIFTSRRIGTLVKAVAPSFQATSLGPALFLAEQQAHSLPFISHEKWMEILGDGSDWGVEELERLLEESGMGDNSEEDGEEDQEFEDEDEPWDEASAAAAARRRSARQPQARLTCDDLAKRTNQLSPNPSYYTPPTSLTSHYLLTTHPSPLPPQPIRTEPLPYDLFPPGMRFFGGGMEPGTRSCVVHANYATGGAKEELLRSRGLWALKGGREEGWTCDADVLGRA